MTATSRPSTVFFWYTAISALLLTAGMPPFALFVTGVVGVEELQEHPVVAGLFVLQVVLSTVAVAWWLERWRRIGRDSGLPRWLPVVAGAPALVAVGVLLWHLLALSGDSGSDGIDPVDMTLLITVLTGLIPLHAPRRWWTAIPSGMALAAMARLSDLPWNSAAPLGSCLLAVVIGLRSSLWLLELVREIEEARQVEGWLALAEERLRFSRDLHDVMGRDLSSIAVTAELVAQLAERGDPRATEHARSISAMARSSLADVRALVRGYRDVDLEAELQGTLSLLRSAGITTHLRGGADEVPAEHAEAATWALREAGTNLLRHADATAVTITLDRDGLQVVNDGTPSGGSPDTAGADPTAPSGGSPDTVADPADPRPAAGPSAASTPVPEGSGLRGLRERIGPGRRLTAAHQGDTFTLSVRFAPEETDVQP